MAKHCEEVRPAVIVYIAGPIKGNGNWEEDFAAAEQHLLSLGHEVLNPAVLGKATDGDEASYGYYFREGVKMLAQAEAVFMLRGWENSAGARAEHLVAVMCGMDLMYQ